MKSQIIFKKNISIFRRKNSGYFNDFVFSILSLSTRKLNNLRNITTPDFKNEADFTNKLRKIPERSCSGRLANITTELSAVS